MKISFMHDTTRRLFEAIQQINGSAVSPRPKVVCDFMGVSPNIVTNWKHRGLSKEGMATAAIKGISVAWLEAGVLPVLSSHPVSRKAVNVYSGVALIPLLDRKTAGMHERYTTGGEEPPSTHAHPGQVEPGLFAYQVDDDLMEPTIQKGCIATISTRVIPRHGMCVLIQDGEDAYIRRLVVDGGAQLIESPRYPARPLPGRIIGVVHQVSTVFVNLGEEP